MWLRLWSWVVGVRRETEWNRTIEKPSVLQLTPTVVVSIAMALPDGAWIVGLHSLPWAIHTQSGVGGVGDNGHVVLERASYSASVVQLYSVEQSGSHDTQDGTGASVKTHSSLTKVHSPAKGVWCRKQSP